ncbi:hypothetical protein KFK09_006582 [Dendrobium nobile]|uniref:ROTUNDIFOLIA like 8 n=1 Tax=Dendrobium nobile TaxID=94219 RepID=A0A8T3BPN0_DENNO|nr:hypothetical protein KFK09_006582 [Dendrobium nobile]
MELCMEEKWKLAKKQSKKAAATEEKKPSSSVERSFRRRCSELVKEQRSRFYIMRRCVIMLIQWRDLA